MEPIFKIAITLVGVVVVVFFDEVQDGDGLHIKAEVLKVFENGHMASISGLHHITMFCAFALSGVVDIVSLFITVPRHTSQLFFSLAFWVEGILFYFHTSGRDPLNIHVHLLLTALIFLCGIFSLLRMLQPTNLLINIGLAGSVLLQGTWFIQAGYILFRWNNWLLHASDSEGDGDDHKALQLATVYFTWHLIAIALFLILLWVAFHLMIRLKLPRSLLTWPWVDGDQEEQETLISAGIESAPKDSRTATVELQDIAEAAT